MKTLLLLAVLDWNADFTHLLTELPKMHPNPWHITTREAFVGEIDKLRARVPEMQDHEVAVELARIIATIGDGHTRLTLPLDPGYGFFQGHAKTAPAKIAFHAVPERYVILSNGLFTTDGKRVTRIGRLSAEEAIAAVMPVAHGDNEMQKKEVAAGYLAVPEVLHARGVIGSLDEVETMQPRPRPQTKPWSFEHLPEKKAVVFTFNEAANTKEESLAQFSERMFRFIDEHPVEKLVIDLRNNYGGNGSLNRAVLHGLIRSKKLQAPGSVFVLIGRRTFSAAIFFLVDLEQHTHAIFVGEPTGGAPNGYGDSRRLVLPESGVTVRISTLYWQKSDPRDKRTTIEPHVDIEPSFGSDAAMATALDFFGAPAEGGRRYTGVVSIDHERIPVTIVDGKIVEKDLAQYRITLRQGTKRAAGTMTAEGRDYLIVASAP
ncbi:MAG TPA: S41 family peptidase [Thermoanaerobaculia bacterium]|nr:S41 family peptidase [Thermoanaerobaculia bacterium]